MDGLLMSRAKWSRSIAQRVATIALRDFDCSGASAYALQRILKSINSATVSGFSFSVPTLLAICFPFVAPISRDMEPI